LLLYTDGLVEARASDGRLFELDHRNIAAALRRNATRVLPLLGITSP
jgi:serine phosphatase RsbU (regulator of sigma subunit)